MRGRVYKAFCVFVFTFCAPALVLNALQSYSATGQKIGQKIYETVNENN